MVAHKSSAYVQELVGLVVGQGFKALIKPESWAATHAADHVVRSARRRAGPAWREDAEAWGRPPDLRVAVPGGHTVIASPSVDR